MSQATLDDPAAVDAVDRSGMLSVVAGLGDHLRRGFELGQATPASELDHKAIAVCGMGGSGIAGDVVRGLLADRLPVPVVVRKGYGVPSFAGPGTLVFAVSYSGNTEETLASYEEAVARGCRTVSISSGGRLAELARTEGGVHAEVPGDVPMPRAALGYLAGAILGMVAQEWRLDLSPEVAAAAGYLQRAARQWEPAQPTEANEAKSLAEYLLGRAPVIWGAEGLMEPVALRWKNQMNENAKVSAFWSVLPELDHNEVEGWSPETGKEFAVVGLRHPDEHPRVAERFALTLELASGAGLDVREVEAEGDGPMQWLFGSILLGDFVSTYLGILRGVDPTPVPALTGLKKRLGG
jgi:glucose/mannose-6-phosphate isomerase